MKRLLEIDAKVNPERQGDLQVETDNADAFTRKKRELASVIREIREVCACVIGLNVCIAFTRQDIKNRDAARGNDSNADMAKRGYEIREKIKAAEELGEDLEQIHKKKTNKLQMVCIASRLTSHV